ncbi:hypothetical protein GGI15_002550 [Coemansia interrupta]|uniref:Uncharacterized protein n=1 Tax=Coemansia interrupta TaxID=1126814 RepID=A0A9W8HD54_9FUNG|nr:hypothetical protein GGI15_002550 [Coemansia interrupta]
MRLSSSRAAEGPHDVFSLVTPADIRRIRDHAQENFIKLIDKVFDRLLVLKATKDLDKNPLNTRQLLNCVRILTRLVPFVYEASPDGSVMEDIVFWTQRPRPGSGVDYTLGRQLVSATVDLLFTSGFTVPPATVGEDAAVRYTIWENGIGQTSSLGSSKEHVANRIEVLRLLLVICSKTMYVPAAGSVTLPNRALHAIAYNSNKRMVLCLLCSLINTSLRDRVQGWAIPYRNSTAMDPNDELSLHAMQALFILLDYQTPPSKPDGEPGSGVDQPDDAEADSNTPAMVLVTGTSTGAQNLFRVFIAKLHRTQEFDYLHTNIMRLLDESMRANLSILASVTKQPTKHAMPQEAAILLWILLENNAPFKDYLVDHNSSLRLFSVLLYFMLNGYNDPAQAGLVRTISHILHYLSEDSRFATRLMQPFDQSILPSTMRTVDASLTHADFMINTVFTLLSASKPYLVPVYSNLLLLVRNVSPYLTQVSQTTADKLVSLFDIISSPAFIISESYHVRWLIYLIEVFDYVVHYRAVDNPRLMYSMVKARSYFTRLRSFSLDKARSELAQLREKKSMADSARTIGRSSTPREISQSMDDSATKAAETLSSLSLSDAASVDARSLDANAASESGDTSEPTKSAGGTASPALSEKARGKRPAASYPEDKEQQQTQPERSRGKGKERAGVDSKRKTKVASNSTGQRQFQPSEEWVFSWLPDLPLDPIIQVLDALATQVDRIAEEVQRDAQAAAAAAAAANANSAQMLGGDTKADGQQAPQSPTGQSADTAIAAVTADPTQTIIHWLSSDAMLQVLPDLEESMPEIRPRVQGLSPALVVWFRSLLWSIIYASGMKPFGIWKNTNVRLFVVKHSA